MRCRRVRGSSRACRRSARRRRRTVRRAGGSRRAPSDAASSAPSKSSRIGSVQATASCSALCRCGSSTGPSNRSMASIAARALASSPTSTAVTAHVNSTSARACSSNESARGRSSSIHARPSVIRSRICQNSQSTRNMWGSGVMSWVKNQRIATRRFSSSTPSRSAHSTCRSAGQLTSRHQLGEVLGVSPGDVGTGVAGGEPLGGELPHRDEHAEARSTVVGDDADEAVAGERVEEVQRLVLGARDDTGGRVDRPPVGEHRQRLHELALPVVEQPEAPLDGRPQGALALGEVDGSRAQRVEDVFESGQQAPPARAPACGPRRARSPAADHRGAGRSP